MLEDKEIGEIWASHADGCNHNSSCEAVRQLIRKLVAERVELRSTDFILYHHGDCCLGTKREHLKGACVKRDWSDAQWTAEVLREFGIPEETWKWQ